MNLYALAGRYFGRDGFFHECIFQVDRRTVSQPHHTSPCSSGHLVSDRRTVSQPYHTSPCSSGYLSFNTIIYHSKRFGQISNAHNWGILIEIKMMRSTASDQKGKITPTL